MLKSDKIFFDLFLQFFLDSHVPIIYLFAAASNFINLAIGPLCISSWRKIVIGEVADNESARKNLK